MTALSAGRATPARANLLISAALAASAIVYEGGMVGINASGYLVPATAAATLHILGVATATVDNSAGAAGDKSCDVERSKAHRFNNSSSTDAIAAANIGKPCYVVDDNTVALTDNSGARPRAGIIKDVDSSGVWVDFNAALAASPTVLTQSALSTKASDAAVARFVSPVAGKISKIRTVTNGALAAADATATGAIGVTAITGGVVTITQAGSAAGDLDEASPSAANTVLPGSLITVTFGGGSTATATANVQVEITPH